MAVQTNKEYLQQLQDQLNQMQKDQFVIATEISSMKNDHQMFMQRISGILLNDRETDQKGLVAIVERIETRVSGLENKIEMKEKITAGKIAVAASIFSGIGAFLTWVYTNFLKD